MWLCYGPLLAEACFPWRGCQQNFIWTNHNPLLGARSWLNLQHFSLFVFRHLRYPLFFEDTDLYYIAFLLNYLQQ
jgi:hypothetical protein